ncbi:MAG TPA: hypothetical protein VMF30_03240 [Pirellulales bacterium]|nr:hypothetical protein [Pirellulales bacterium]
MNNVSTSSLADATDRRVSPVSATQVARTLLWEHWACSWRAMLAGPIAALLWPALLAVIIPLRMAKDVARETLEQIVSSPFIVFSVLMILAIVILVSQGKSRWRYTLPAANFPLVAVPLACVMLTMLVQYCLVAWLVAALLGIHWPILGPGLSATVALGWCQAVLWSTANSRALQWAAVLASVVVAAELATIAAERFGSGMYAMWYAIDVDHGAYVTLFAVAAPACFVVGTLGFGLQRRGSVFDPQVIVAELERRFFGGRASAPSRFASPASAQTWLEWRERGWSLPFVVATCGLICGLYIAWHWQGTDRTVVVAHNAIALFAGLSMFATVLIGFYWGARSPSFDFPAFAGSRPLADSKIAGCVLRGATLSLAVSVAIWMAMSLLFLVVALEEKGNLLRAFHSVLLADVAYVAATVALAALSLWSVACFAASLALGGGRVLRIALLLAAGVVIFGLMFPLALPYTYRSDAFDLYWTATLVLCVAGCLAAFVIAWRRRFVTLRVVALAVAIVLLAIGMHLVRADFSERALKVDSWFYMISFYSLLPLPLAAAPLAVRVSRHR